MQIRPLDTAPLEVLHNVFNQAFSDYSVTVKYTEDGFQNKLKAENIDLRYSPGAFINDELVAFILHGLDNINGENKVFNAGTGVVPEHRGKRIVEKLYLYILPLLADEGYHQHQLEVLEGNVKAENIYSKVGFKRSRKVSAFKGSVPNLGEKFFIEEVPDLDWHIAESFWNVAPTWQNNSQCIRRTMQNHRIFVAHVDSILAGYVISDVTNGRLKQFAVKPEYRRKGIGTALLSHAALNGEISFTNFDEEDTGSIAFFKSLNLKRVATLFEMTYFFNN